MPSRRQRERLCHKLNDVWRDRLLGPVATLHAVLLQFLRGNVACDAVPHFMQAALSGDAYMQARLLTD